MNATWNRRPIIVQRRVASPRTAAFACALMALLLPAGRAAPAEVVEHVYDGARMPDAQTPPWGFHPQTGTAVAVENGALRVADDGTAQGQLQFITRPWSADPVAASRVEAEVRVRRCSDSAGVILLAANGAREAGLTLYPDRVALHRLGTNAPVRLDDAFHRVAMEMCGRDLRVIVDGVTVLDLTGRWDWPAHEGRNVVGFGSLSSAATGEALWKSLRAVTTHPDAQTLAGAEHVVVYRQPDVYACFPSLVRAPDGTLVTRFGTRSKRSHIDPTGGSAVRCSKDGGRTWFEPPTGFETRDGHTLRADGHRAIVGAIGWLHAPEARRAELESKGLEARPSKPGMVAYASGARFCVRKADGRTPVVPWTPIAVPPHRVMMGYNSAADVNLGAGTRLVSIYDVTPDGRRDALVLRSTDDGDSWACLRIARGEPDLGFSETALGTNAAGQVIALLRTAETPRDRGFLYQSVSTDRGLTWSAPRNTGMWGYPAHLLALPDGRLLATYGYRRAPMGIRATLSNDGGRTWETNATVILRADGRGSGSDLGYPLTTLLEDGTLLTVYYFNAADNVTHIAATRWRPPGK